MNLGFKIHSFDNSNSVPWEYYPTFADCEVGDVMKIFEGYDGMHAITPLASIGVKAEMSPLYINMTKITGLSKKNSGASFENFKYETAAAVPIRSDMVIEGVRTGGTATTDSHLLTIKLVSTDEGDHVVFGALNFGSEGFDYSDHIIFKELSAEPLGIEIDGQPAYKVLVRYMG